MQINQMELFRQEIRHVTHIHKQISTTTDRKSMMEKKNAKLEQESKVQNHKQVGGIYYICH